ncbi:hypothetical protein RBE51_17585 [Pseudomonas taiwanensis]|uniref:ADP-ribosyltransferase-containing protein n=1 Tax=Pseudomonas taiwanensis TaxID=470150 RepID=UPI0028E0378A|nr:hypothetical protein [Pseudomonas taiwanensis]MDT8924622.1 hypothetical protein [Pseudomonas taiwanensis]
MLIREEKVPASPSRIRKKPIREIPAVVYHGTNFDFDVFDSKRLGLSCDNPTTGFGHFFSDNRDEALSWAFRATSRRDFTKNPGVVSADITRLKLVEVSAKKFAYYLQTARGETIHRHRGKWQQAGYDGLRVKLEDVEWFCVFDPAKIMILGRERHHGPKVERVSNMLSTNSVKPDLCAPATLNPGQVIIPPSEPREASAESADRLGLSISALPVLYHGTTRKAWRKSDEEPSYLYLTSSLKEAEHYAQDAGEAEYEDCGRAHPIVVKISPSELRCLLAKPGVEIQPDWGWVEGMEHDARKNGGTFKDSDATWQNSLTKCCGICLGGFQNSFKKLFKEIKEPEFESPEP